MEMPVSCYKCCLKQRNGMDIVCHVTHERFSVADVNILEYRLDSCPLVPVPDHGRLGDLDALHKLFLEKGKEYNGVGGAMVAAAAWCIANAPTIIPAEKEE
jgi:hypothetical protein